MKKIIYTDNAATTRLEPEVLEAMMPYLEGGYGNPSSVYSLGREARLALDLARKETAAALFCDADEIYFTSSGTEADNWVLKNVSENYKNKGRHIITSQIEHHAILHSAQELEKQGFKVTYLPVDKHGVVSVDTLKKALTPETVLVSIMYANNEVGTIQPIEELSKAAKEAGALFHTDAVQAAGHVPINLKNSSIDFLSLSAHKFGGPKGIGALYAKKGSRISSFLHGGAQEKGKRASTENVAGIVGLSKALTFSVLNMEKRDKRVKAMRDYLTRELLRIPYTRLNGHPEKRLSNNVNISIEYIEGESLLLMLDMKGICASSGSACTSGSLDPSHVLLAMGLSHETAHGSLRLSLSHNNNMDEMDEVIEAVCQATEKLRSMSPLFENVKK